MLIDKKTMLDFLIQFCLIFICGFAGVYIHQIYSLLKGEIMKLEIKYALLTCTTLTFILVGMCEMLIEYMGLNVFITFCFLSGVGFYKIIDRVFDGSIFRLFITILIKAKKDITESIEDFVENDIDEGNRSENRDED